MSANQPLPTGLELVRTTPVFDQDSVPAGLLAAHQIAEGVWGRLIVSSGKLDFVHEDGSGEICHLVAGDHHVIPPAALHHVALDGSSQFRIEFHRPARAERHRAKS